MKNFVLLIWACILLTAAIGISANLTEEHTYSAKVIDLNRTSRNMKIAGGEITIHATDQQFFYLVSEDGKPLYAVPPESPSTEWVLGPTQITSGLWDFRQGMAHVRLASESTINVLTFEQYPWQIITTIIVMAVLLWLLMLLLVF